MQFDIYNCLFVFTRVSAFLLVLPFFSVTNFPVTMRIAVGALVSLLITPLVPPFAQTNLDMISLVGVLTQEVCVGLLLGFLTQLIFFTVEMAGVIIATEMGLNMAAVFDPFTSQQEQIPSTILFYLSAMVMLTLNLHHWMLLGFERTYMVLPIGSAHLNVALFETIVAKTAEMFGLALQIAAPVMAVSFVVTLVFALLGRAVPQMNVFSESFVFRIAAGLIVFGFTLQVAAQYVRNYLDRLPDDLLAVAQMLGGSR